MKDFSSHPRKLLTAGGAGIIYRRIDLASLMSSGDGRSGVAVEA